MKKDIMSKLFFSLLIFLGGIVYGQSTVDLLQGGAISGGTIVVTDPSYQLNGNFEDLEVNNFIRLRMINVQNLTNQSSWELKVTGNVTSYNRVSTPLVVAEAVELTLSYNSVTGTLITDESVYRFADAYKVVFSNITVNDPSLLTADIELSVGIAPERYYTFDENFQLSPVHVVDAENNEFTFTWDYAVGAFNYQLEWWYQSADDVNYGEEIPAFQSREATRVTTNEQSYTISNVYDAGRILYRVRAVSKLAPDYERPYYGAWSEILSSNVIELTQDFDDTRNWSYNVVYGQGGKKGESLTIYDATGRVRQSIVKDSEEDHLIVSEGFYDYDGVPTIQVLPGVVPSTKMAFYENFTISNTNGVEKPFDKENFGYDEKIDNPDPIFQKANTSNEFHNNYFSENNPFLSDDGLEKYLPVDNGYGFTQTLFDAEGRVTKQSGVGATHKMGSDHETQIWYGNPSQYELDALFGNDAGHAIHYSKVLTRDANGQLTVATYNMAGQVIYTAKVGDAPANLDPSNDFDQTPQYETIDVSNQNTFYSSENSYMLTYDLFATEIGDYDIDYTLTKTQYDQMCNSPQGDCVYDWFVTVTNNMGEVVKRYPDNGVADEYYTIQAADFTDGVYSEAITFSVDGDLVDFGAYTVQKHLILNQQAKEAAVNQFSEYITSNTNPCLKSKEDYYNEILSSYSASYCDECLQQCEEYATQEATINGVFDQSIYDTKLSECQLDNCESLDAVSPSIYSGFSCGQIFNAILADMSPGGQYFDGVPHQSGQLPNDSWLNANFPGGMPSFFTNRDMDTWDEVREGWDENWINESGFINGFLIVHPEYCNYEWCLSTQGVQDFHNDLALLDYESFLAEYNVQDVMNPQAAGYTQIHSLDPLISFTMDHANDIYDINLGDISVNPERFYLTKANTIYTDYQPGLVDITTGDIDIYEYSKQQAIDEFGVGYDTPENIWYFFKYNYLAISQGWLAPKKANFCPSLEVSSTFDYNDLDGINSFGYTTNEGYLINFPVEGIIDDIPTDGTYDVTIFQGLVDNANPCVRWTAMQSIANLAKLTPFPLTGTLEVGVKSGTTEEIWGSIVMTGVESAEEFYGLIKVFINSLDNGYVASYYNQSIVVENFDADIYLTNKSFLLRIVETQKTIVNRFIKETDCPEVVIDHCFCQELGGIKDEFNYFSDASINWEGQIFNTTDLSFDQNGDADVDYYDYVVYTLNRTHGAESTYLFTAYNGTVATEVLTETQILTWEQNCNANEGFTDLYKELDCFDWSSECEESYSEWAATQAEQLYNQYYAQAMSEFEQLYYSSCFSGTFNEKVEVTLPSRTYHYTLYIYDAVGNLTATVQPEGVKRIEDPTVIQKIQDYRNGLPTGEAKYWKDIHNIELATQYTYNSLGGVLTVSTPDAGDSKYFYDQFGRLLASQNDEQANIDNDLEIMAPSGNRESTVRFSYTKLDDQDRVSEVGEVSIAYEAPLTNPKDIILGQNSSFNFDSWLNSGVKREVTKSFYDVPLESTEVNNEFGGEQNGTYARGRITAVAFYEDGNVDDVYGYSNASYYGYDEHGLVETYVQDLPYLALAQSRFRTTNYEYDLLKGVVTKVNYQDGKPDAFYTKYEYDGKFRLKRVFTSEDDVLWDQDAKYVFYKHGPLARIELGDKQVQGMDFAYTIQGGLKGVNSGTLNASRDLGRDGTGVVGNPNNTFARDAFGFVLGYYNNDYEAIGSVNNTQWVGFETDLKLENNLNLSNAIKDYYNGSISYAITALYEKPDGVNMVRVPQLMAYDYDQLYRLTEMEVFESNDVISTNNWTHSAWRTEHSAPVASKTESSYYSKYTYDSNGNLRTLLRNGQNENGSDYQMDDLFYHYNEVNGDLQSNRLYQVKDFVGQGTPTDGSDYARFASFNAQDVENGNDFTYDDLGNISRDLSSNIEKIVWNSSRRVKEIVKKDFDEGSDVEFIYDGFGRRVGKIEKTKKQSGAVYVLNEPHLWKYYSYSLDASGIPMAIYEHELGWKDCAEGNCYELTASTLTDQHLYGSGRLGVIKRNVKLIKEIKDEIVDKGSYALARLIKKQSTETSLSDVITLKIDGTPIHSPVTWTNGAENSAQLIANAINSTNTSPNFNATVYNGSYLLITSDNNDDLSTSLLSIEIANGNTVEAEVLDGGQLVYADTKLISGKLGNKYFELSNHLGSVVTVVSDKKDWTKQTDVESLEEFNNGTNDHGWSAGSVNIVGNVLNNQLEVSTNTSLEYIEKTISTTIGESYQVIFDLGMGIDATYTAPEEVIFLVENSTGSEVYVTSTYGSAGIVSIDFIAKTSSTKLKLINNHSQNVSVGFTIDNLSIVENGYYTADIVTVRDYYPYGMPMPGRNWDISSYRYGYQGSEMDNEVKGEGNHYTTEFRQLDPRLGRWFSVDPLAAQFPNQSPYNAMACNPIMFTDRTGAAPDPIESEYLPWFFDFDNSFANGIADGLIGAAPEMYEFLKGIITDSEVREQFVESIKMVLADPVGVVMTIAKDKYDLYSSVLSGNGTEQQEYDVGKEIGNLIFGIASGAASKKILDLLKDANKTRKLSFKVDPKKLDDDGLPPNKLDPADNKPSEPTQKVESSVEPGQEKSTGDTQREIESNVEEKSQLEKNKDNGAQHEQETYDALVEVHGVENVKKEVTLAPQDGQAGKTRADIVVRDNNTGEITIYETKTGNAKLTGNQARASDIVHNGNGMFEVRTDFLKDWGYKKGDLLTADQYKVVYKNLENNTVTLKKDLPK